jgi:hypothetical protein
VEPDEPLSARDEIRVSEFGLLRCPSCGELAAEIIMTGHCLIMLPLDGDEGPPGCECRDGERVTITDYDQAVAAANISLADAVNFGDKQHWRWLYYPEPGGMTGLMEVL